MSSFREVTRAYEQKLGLDFRSGKERNAWYILEGRQLYRLTIPHQHSGKIKPKMLSKMIRQSKLNKAEFSALVNCPMSGADYEARIRDLIRRGLL